MAFLSFPSPTQLRNLSDPAANSDAATKQYVDSSLSNGTGTISVGNVSATGNVAASGNVTANSANLGNAVTANYFVGDGSQLTGIAGSSISGQVANALVAGTVYTNAQPNITSVGTLTSLTVSGDISGNNFTVNGNLTVLGSTLTVNNEVINQTETVTGNLIAGNVSFSGSNVSLGNISNLHISGGNLNEVIRTDGAGNLSWAPQAVGVLTGIIDEFTGTGTTTAFTLSTTPSSKNVTFVVVQGVMQPKSSYSVSGTTLTFSTAPPNTAFIEVTTMTIA